MKEEDQFCVFPVTRYIVTRYVNDGEKSSVYEIGEFPSKSKAISVAEVFAESYNGTYFVKD